MVVIDRMVTNLALFLPLPPWFWDICVTTISYLVLLLPPEWMLT